MSRRLILRPEAEAEMTAAFGWSARNFSFTFFGSMANSSFHAANCAWLPRISLHNSRGTFRIGVRQSVFRTNLRFSNSRFWTFSICARNWMTSSAGAPAPRPGCKRRTTPARMPGFHISIHTVCE